MFSEIGEQNVTNHDIEEEKLFSSEVLSGEVEVVVKLKKKQQL